MDYLRLNRGSGAADHRGTRSSAGRTILKGSVVDWSRIRISLSDDTWAALKNGWKQRWEDWRAGSSDTAKARWAAWREARAERDVLGSYRAGYGEEARFRWWQRLRAGVGLFLVVALMGAGLTMLVGLFFIGFTIALETLV